MASVILPRPFGINEFSNSSINTINTNSKKLRIRNEALSAIPGLDQLITFLLSYNIQLENARKTQSYCVGKPFRYNIPIPMMVALSKRAAILFKNEPGLLRIQGTFYIFGDIHGQYSDLIRFLEKTGLPPSSNLVFLGDYVDRGNNSLEVIALLFALKIKYPNNVFLIRGNHECSSINKQYGFYDECIERYSDNKTDASKLWNIMNETLHHMPIALVINNSVFCVHGGISPHLKDLDDINKCTRGDTIPDDGLLCDLTWSDPKKHSNSSTNWIKNDRGVSYFFNEKALDEFMDATGIQMVCRAHQSIKTGFQFFNKQKLITVFSAPNYCGTFGNDAAVMFLNENLEYSFIILKPKI
jgi:serine/threonine-protein phosphatase PP1 catalytic subunit